MFSFEETNYTTLPAGTKHLFTLCLTISVYDYL